MSGIVVHTAEHWVAVRATLDHWTIDAQGRVLELEVLAGLMFGQNARPMEQVRIHPADYQGLMRKMHDASDDAFDPSRKRANFIPLQRLGDMHDRKYYARGNDVKVIPDDTVQPGTLLGMTRMPQMWSVGPITEVRA